MLINLKKEERIKPDGLLRFLVSRGRDTMDLKQWGGQALVADLSGS